VEVALKYLLSSQSRSLRNLLADELENVSDLLLRQAMRKAFGALIMRMLTCADVC
jgi:hypothetical protein